MLIWREGFYTPLIVVSAAASLAAYRPALAYRWWLRFLLLAVATVAALNLVPPAWTPARLLEAEFRLQTASLVILLVAVALAPFLGLLPRLLAATVVTLLAMVAIAVPLHGFYQVLPAIQALYNQPLSAAWGLWLVAVGLVIIIVSYWQLPTKPPS